MSIPMTMTTSTTPETLSHAIRQAVIERAKVAPLEAWGDPAQDIGSTAAAQALFDSVVRVLGRRPNRWEVMNIIDSYQALFSDFLDISWSAACYLLDGDEQARVEMRPVECSEADWVIVIEQACKAAEEAKKRAGLLPEHADEVEVDDADDGEPTPRQARARIHAAGLADYAEVALEDAEAMLACDCHSCADRRSRMARA